MGTKHAIIGIFEDSKGLIESGASLRGRGFDKMDAFTPYPVHGIDLALGIKRSWVSMISLIFGVIGCAAGIGLQVWTSAYDWPINVGGKPNVSWPAFIPIIFECTILFAGIATFFGVLGLCGLPALGRAPIDPRVSDNHFALWVPLRREQQGVEVEQLLKSYGACEVRRA